VKPDIRINVTLQ